MKPISFFLFILSFFIFLLSCKRTTEPLINNAGPDTTSHDFVWTVDTLHADAALQIMMADIWGTDENNVWTIGHSDDYNYQIWHWDGQSWTNINPKIIGDRPSYLAMQGFSNKDIWIVGDGVWHVPDDPDLRYREYILHYDGQNWQRYMEIKAPPATAVWGSSSSNLFVGCDSGVVLHYNGEQWDKTYIGVRAQIMDIYGFSEDSIFASGIERLDNGDHKIIFFKYKNNRWNIAETFLLSSPENEWNFGNFLWGLNMDEFYSAGFGWLFKYNGHSWTKVLKGIHFYGIFGSSANNIFAGSIWNDIYHYNGSSWKKLDFFDKYRLGFDIKIWCNNENVFISGNSSVNGRDETIIFRGKRAEGR